MPSGLRRDLGLAGAASVVIGSMIGVGIFLGPQEIAQQLTTPGLIMLAWVLGGLFVFAGALTYAELGAAMPEAGGQYAYMREAYGPFVAYLTGWSGFAVGKAASVSALAAGFGVYLSALVPLAPLARTAVAVAIIGLVTLVNLVGVRRAGAVAIATMSVKVGALLLLALAGIGALGSGLPALAEAPLMPSGASAGDVLSAFGLALIPVFFAYDGWVNSTQVAEEVRDPARNVPRSLIMGTLSVVALYALANLVYLLALGASGVGNSGFAAVEAATAIAGPTGGTLVVLAVLVSIVGTINAVTMSGPRIAFAMGRDGLFLRDVEKLNRWGTPSRAILLQGAIAVALVLIPPVNGHTLFSALLTYIIVDSFLFYGLGAAAVFILRRKRPRAPRPYRVPLYPWVPLVFVLGSAAFLLNALLTDPWTSLAGLAIVLVGVPGFFYWRAANRPRLLASAALRVTGPEETPRAR